MKTFSTFNESAVISDKQPGNDYADTGVTNHYTPVENILVNINNLFCTRLGIVASIGEDKVSIKLSSNKFVCDRCIDDLLNEPIDRFTTLSSYIFQQGLTKVTKVNLGTYYVVYFSPEDISSAKEPDTMEPEAISYSSSDTYGEECPVPYEANESLVSEFEMSSFIKEDEVEEEMKDLTLEKILELVDSKDKVKAAKQIETLVTQQINLPRDYYFAAIKFKTGEEAIALRWKYAKKLPTGQSANNTRSLIHIFGTGDNGVWVQDFAEDSLVSLPEEVKKLIESVLDIINAKKTNDPSIYKLVKDSDDSLKDDSKDNQKDDEKDYRQDGKQDDDRQDGKQDDDRQGSNSQEEDDVESDKDRGDDSDLLK